MPDEEKRPEAAAEKPADKPADAPAAKADPAAVHPGPNWKHPRPLAACRFDPSGKYIFTGAEENVVTRWDVATGTATPMAGHDSWVRALAFSPSGDTVYSGGYDGRILWWPAAALWKYDTTFRADIGGARSIAFSHDGKQLAVGGITNVTNAFAGIGNPAIVVLDWETAKSAVQYESKAKVQGVAWGIRHHPDGFWVGLSGGGAGGFLFFWKEAAAQEFHFLKLPDTGRDLDLSPDGLSACVAHYDGSLRVYRLHKKA